MNVLTVVLAALLGASFVWIWKLSRYVKELESDRTVVVDDASNFVDGMEIIFSGDGSGKASFDGNIKKSFRDWGTIFTVRKK